MKKYPCYLQEGKNDCGAACIKSILNYYHGDYDYEKLKVELKLDNQGISAYHMIAFLNQNSFISEGKRYNWESFLKKTHLLPMIVVVKNESLRNHYIIIYKISKKKEQMIVGDPKEGIKTISFSQFQQIFTGITISFLLVEPIIQNATHSLSKTLFTFLIRNKKSLILLGSILFIYLFFQLITSFTMRYFIRGIEFQKDKMYFYMIFFTFLSFQWLQKIYEYYIEKVFFHLKIKLQKCLEHRFYFHLLSMDLEQICYSASSHFINKKEEFHIWFETFISFIQFCLLKIPFLFVLLLLFLILFRDFFVLIIFFTIFTILYFFLFYQMVKRKEEQIRTLKEKEMIYFADTTDNLSSIQMLKLQTIARKKHEKLFTHFFVKLKYMFFQIHRIQLIYELIDIVFQLYLLLELSLLVISKKMLLPNFILIQTLGSYFFPLIKELSFLPVQLSKIKVYQKRIESYFDFHEETALFQSLSFHMLEIKDLSYFYHQKQELLTHIELQIHKGEKILLTGSSGSGKSTLLKIITGRLEVERNQVFIDNIDICDYQKKSLQQKFLMITQEENLWTGTLFDNITLGRNVKKEALLEVIRCAKIESMIKAHPKGFKQWIMNHGSQLSGGERQRIILARTLLNPFELLIIDEGFSQIDNHLERMILKRLFYTYYNKTIIVVSHKKENKDLFGRHIELEQKRIIRDESL